MKEKQNLPAYTTGQLALRNGQDREETWVAYQGKIYDVGDSKLWHGGQHYGNWAGQDLTKALENAPHSTKVFEKLAMVGVIKNPKKGQKA